MSKNLKTENINIRCSVEEKKKILAHASANNDTASRYLLKLGLVGYTYEFTKEDRPPKIFLEEAPAAKSRAA